MPTEYESKSESGTWSKYEEALSARPRADYERFPLKEDCPPYWVECLFSLDGGRPYMRKVTYKLENMFTIYDPDGKEIMSIAQYWVMR